MTTKKGRARASRYRLARRARLKGCTVIVPFSKGEIIERDGLVCYMCGRELTQQVTIDHVVPINQGGHHSLENARIACGDCNSRKGSKLPDDC